jgi:hypothetical protein
MNCGPAITENAYRRLASGLRVVIDAGVMRIDDPEATAAVLVASLAYYPMVRLLIGHTPGDIKERPLPSGLDLARPSRSRLRQVGRLRISISYCAAMPFERAIAPDT